MGNMFAFSNNLKLGGVFIVNKIEKDNTKFGRIFAHRTLSRFKGK